MIRPLLIVSLCLFALSACIGERPQNRGALIYDELCAACHGSTGRGNGLLASDIGVAPADLTQLSAQNGGTFPTEDVMAQIYGYPGRYQSGSMPEFGPVLDGPLVDFETESGAVLPTPQALIDLARYLQSIQE